MFILAQNQKKVKTYLETLVIFENLKTAFIKAYSIFNEIKQKMKYYIFYFFQKKIFNLILL